MFMSDNDKKLIYEFNNSQRQKLLTAANTLPSPEKRLEFVVQYFINKLTPEETKKIDGVETTNPEPFLYDYSYLEDFGATTARQKKERRYNKFFTGVTLPMADIDRRGDEKINVYPTIFALKLGTCIMFAAEIQRFCHDFGIKGKIVSEPAYCYDHFDGKSTEFEDIKTDRIIKMLHYYNVVEIGTKKYKIDIAGYLMAEDYNTNHPQNPINPQYFYFSTTHENPFDQLIPDNSNTLEL